MDPHIMYVDAKLQVPEGYVPEARLDVPAAAVGNMLQVSAPSSTLNLNQASCMVERPTLTGRSFTNVCTGQQTFLPYTGIEIAMGIFFLLFFGFILTNFFRIGRRMGR